MRTAIVHNHPIHYKHLLFQEMVKLGLDFTVLFGGTQSSIRSEDTPLSQDLYKHHFLFNGPVEDAPAIPRILAAVRALRKLKPSVVISCGYERPENWAAWFWALYNRVPVILWYESNQFDWPRFWWKELPKRIFMKGIAGAHVYGVTNRDYLIQLGLDPNSIRIKRAVVDVERFSLPQKLKRYRHDSKTCLLYVGRLAREKNLPFLIQSFCDARKRTRDSLRLTIIGTGPEEKNIRSRIANLNLSTCVSLKGYIPQAELMPYLRDADFFVLPSTREPWGLVALEAMIARVPVLLSTRCGCAADLISPNTGWSFSPFDSAELTSIIATLPDISAARLHEMGEAAHSVAIDYSPRNSAETIVQSIRDLHTHSNRISVPVKTKSIAPRL